MSYEHLSDDVRANLELLYPRHRQRLDGSWIPVNAFLYWWMDQEFPVPKPPPPVEDPMFVEINSIDEIQPIHALADDKMTAVCGSPIISIPVQFRKLYFFDVVNVTENERRVTCSDCLREILM